MEQLLEGKVAVVTGGTRGIGFEIVRKFLSEGASVVLFGSREESAVRALGEIRAEFPDKGCMAMWPDLTDPVSVGKAMESVVNDFGGIDILVNNAGISQRTLLEEYTMEEYDRIMDLNVRAVFVCTRSVVPYMKERKGGVIANTSSVVSLYGQPSGFAYPASKFAVNGITRSLARELGKYNIRVNAVAPGVVRTDMVGNLPEHVIKPVLDRIPLGRMASADDIANAFLYLCSDMASYVTGTVISVDGGVII